MNTLNKDLIKLFNLKEGEKDEIHLYNDEMCIEHKVYLSRLNHKFKISIPFEDEVKSCNATFQDIRMFNETLLDESKGRIDVLSLSIKDTGDLESFLLLMNEFIKFNGNDFNLFLSTTYYAFNKSINLLKYSKNKYLVASTISELVLLKELYSKDKNIKWILKNYESRIIKDKEVIEVKPNINDFNVTLDSDFFNKEDKKLYLVNLKLDKDGKSINTLYKNMLNLEYDKESLRRVLNNKGLIKNTPEREVPYKIESIYLYDLNSLDIKMSNEHVTSYSVTIDLKKIPFEVIK